MKRNVRSTRPISVNTVWWFTQTIPRVRNEIAYAAYDGHSARSWCATDPSWLSPSSRISNVAAIANTPSLKVSRRAVSFMAVSLGSAADELLRFDDPERDLHRAAAARVAGVVHRLGARSRGEARRGRLRLHRGRRGSRGDDAREPRRIPALAPASADARRQRATGHLGRGARHALACPLLPRAGRGALDRARGSGGRRCRGVRGVRRADAALECSHAF